MKVLLLYADMLRTNLLNIYDKKNPNTSLDDTLRNLNGIYYKNAFTPGPDTPRSSGCLWSSMYPKFNGCNTRIKYPKHYLNDNHKTFLYELKLNGYEFNFFINDSYRKTGIIPDGFDDCGHFSDNMSLNEFTKNINIDKNSLTFIYLPDYHYAVGEFGCSLKSHIKGCNVISDAIKLIDDNISLSTFDLIIFFSDHGFKLKDEKRKFLNEKISDNRCKIFMYLKDNNCNSTFCINEDLHSIMDIGPTILKYCNINCLYNPNGNNLFEKLDRNMILIEDHNKFNVDLNQNIFYYAIAKDDDLIVFDCHLNYSSTKLVSESQKNDYIEYFKNYASFFDDNIKQQKILDLYNDNKDSSHYYFDGTRVTDKFSIIDILKKFILKQINRS